MGGQQGQPCRGRGQSAPGKLTVKRGSVASRARHLPPQPQRGRADDHHAHSQGQPGPWTAFSTLGEGVRLQTDPVVTAGRDGPDRRFCLAPSPLCAPSLGGGALWQRPSPQPLSGGSEGQEGDSRPVVSEPFRRVKWGPWSQQEATSTGGLGARPLFCSPALWPERRGQRGHLLVLGGQAEAGLGPGALGEAGGVRQ